MRERLKKRGKLRPRKCLGKCGTIMIGRAKKCRACKLGKWLNAVETLGRRVQPKSRYREPRFALYWHCWG